MLLNSTFGAEISTLPAPHCARTLHQVVSSSRNKELSTVMANSAWTAAMARVGISLGRRISVLIAWRGLICLWSGVVTRIVRDLLASADLCMS